MDRVVDIVSDDLSLSAHRGSLVVRRDRGEQGGALDDIQAAIVHAHGVTWKTRPFVALAEHGTILVPCADTNAATAFMSPIEGHHPRAARMRAKRDAARPLFRQIWQKSLVTRITVHA
ncbi:hypothetical protein ACQKO5_20680 [Novosphingobium subterraneum]|uniref:hypothetical protein n=1 Tax=Novosphingobium subterraneum TaxID=48936 RepID=UPI003CFC8E5E